MGDFTNNKIWPPGAVQGSNMNCSTKFERSDVKITPYMGQIHFWKYQILTKTLHKKSEQ